MRPPGRPAASSSKIVTGIASLDDIEQKTWAVAYQRYSVSVSTRPRKGLVATSRSLASASGLALGTISGDYQAQAGWRSAMASTMRSICL